MIEEIYFTWAQGFMSGLNMASAVQNGVDRDLGGTAADMSAQKIHIRSFCDSHPLVQYGLAVLDLYNSLPPKRENSN
jgi:hypothetical protein